MHNDEYDMQSANATECDPFSIGASLICACHRV